MAETTTPPPLAAAEEIAKSSGWAKVFKAGKIAAIATGIATAVVGTVALIGAWSNSSRSRRKAELAREEELQALQSQVPLAALETGPAPGRAEGEWINRIAASRGQAPALEQPLNPKMEVVPESSVQNLGGR